MKAINYQIFNNLIGVVIKSGLAIILLTSLSSCPGGEAATLIAGNQLDGALDKISWSLEKTTTSTDYLLEKNLRTLQLIGFNLQSELKQELAKNRSFISDELTKNIEKFDNLVDNVKGGVLEVEDFLVLDAQNFVNQLPFKKDTYLIRSIDGYGTMYRNGGTYDFKIIGNAFQPNKFYKVSIDSLEIDKYNVYKKSANNLMFTLPVNKINDRFTDFAVTRTNIKILCFETESDTEPFYEFNGEILLLPKYPIRYELIEYSKKQRWSSEKFNKQISLPMGPTGTSGKYDEYNKTDQVDDPLTQRFTRVISFGTNGSHSDVRSIDFTPDKRFVNMRAYNQCHDCGRTAFATLEYEKLDNYDDSEKRVFESDSQQKGLLNYGTHYLSLGKDYQLFEFKGTFFNGKEVFLNKEMMSSDKDGLRASIAKSEDGVIKRLSLEIKYK